MASIIHIWLYYMLLPYWSIVGLLFALSAYLPPSLAYVAQLASFGARCMSYVAGLGICAFYGSCCSIVLPFFGLAGQAQWATARAFKWLMYLLLGVWLDLDEESIKNRDEARPAVFVGNHQSYVGLEAIAAREANGIHRELDVLFLGHAFPKYVSVTAKSDLKWYPILGQFSTCLNLGKVNV
jgi:lysophosphatidate acyltransferase